MKFKYISALLLFLSVFVYKGYSQVDDEEIMMSAQDTTVNVETLLTLDFGQISAEAKTIKFELPNKGNSILKIENVSIPQGVGILVINETIEPKGKGAIAVIIDPQFMKKGKFTKVMSITTITTDEHGGTTEKKGNIKLKGEIL
jgi:hypothetical protein